MKAHGHIYLANLIIRDLENGGGYLNIPGMGEYVVPPVVRNTILNNKEAFRAGALGPDAYPDVVFGQMYIHTKEDINSGLWLMIMFEELKYADMGNKDGQAAFAFTLGFMMHYSTDLFTHTYVNEYAGGPFKMSDTKNVKRHIALESYIDRKIPANMKIGDLINVKAPAQFVINCFGKYYKKYGLDISGDLRSSGEYDKYASGTRLDFNSKTPFSLLLELRKTLRRFVDKYQPYRGNILKYAALTNAAGYADKWIADIDRALISWIGVSDRIASAMVDPNKDTFDEATSAIGSWKWDLASAVGIPDAIVKILSLVPDLMDLIPIVKDIKDYIEKKFFELLLKIICGLFDNVAEWRDAIKNPEKAMNSSLFKDGKETTNKVDRELGNFGKETNTSKQTFKAFADSLSMAKLCLLGTDNLNTIFSGSKISFKAIEALDGYDRIRVRIKTKNAWFAGTDDDVFFGVDLHDGRSFRTLCDRPGVNDFERGSEREYVLELPYNVRTSLMKSFYVEKKRVPSAGGDWNVEWAHVRIGNHDFGKKGINKILKKDQRHYFTDNMTNKDMRTLLCTDSRIVAFIKSLDECDQWKFAQFSEHTNFKKIFGIGGSGTTAADGAGTGTAPPLKQDPFVLAKNDKEDPPGLHPSTPPNDPEPLLIHRKGCKYQGTLVADLGLFAYPKDALSAALEKGYKDIGLCREFKAPLKNYVLAENPDYPEKSYVRPRTSKTSFVNDPTPLLVHDAGCKYIGPFVTDLGWLDKPWTARSVACEKGYEGVGLCGEFNIMIDPIESVVPIDMRPFGFLEDLKKIENIADILRNEPDSLPGFTFDKGNIDPVPDSILKELGADDVLVSIGDKFQVVGRKDLEIFTTTGRLDIKFDPKLKV